MENVKKGFYSNFFGLFLLFVYFWYIEGPALIFKRVWLFLLYVSRSFSLSILIKTYFKPWRKIVTSKEGGLPKVFAAWRDNAISRLVGMAVRTFAIFAALFVESLAFLLSVFVFILWIILPILAIYTLFLSLAYL